ncbi:MAG: PIG-L family deacetylase [Planctomycetes bacterium]|nr:PIG-L family deacetylase [Planctomycetota bacterium]
MCAKKRMAQAEPKTAMAIAAHPDDIEFMMAGTLLLLKQAGWKIHCLILSTGDCGTPDETKAAIVARRLKEAKASFDRAGFVFQKPFVGDLEIFYDKKLLERVISEVRVARPSMVFTQSLTDYMEDHDATARLAAMAVFCRSMNNIYCKPKRPPFEGDCALYHALPHGLTDNMRHPVEAEMFVDVASVFKEKQAMLNCHASQKLWLDVSQGMDAYLKTQEEMARAVGKMSGKFKLAEGWRRHNHLAFTRTGAVDPLSEALGGLVAKNKKYKP